MFDWKKNKKNVENFIENFIELKEKFTNEELSIKFAEIEAELNNDDEILNPSSLEKNSSFFSIFKPVEGYFITPILIYLNIIVFAIMVLLGVDFFSPSSDNLILWGANFRPLILDGEWWRLVTNCFLHIGIFHLLMNMYALMYIGVLLEPYLGKFKFVSAYLLAGLLASVTSLWWHDFTISAGASGAIFGMYGVFLALLTTNLIEKNTRKTLLTSISIFVGYNLIYGLKGDIDNAAHIGGLIAGLIIGYAYTFNLDEENQVNLKYKIVGTFTIVFSVVTFIVCNGLNNDLAVYSSRMKEFYDMEKMALEIYSRVNYEPKEELLYDIKDRGIYYWNANIDLINEVDKLNLPDEIHQKNSKILSYCELRVKSFQLIYKAVSEETNKYDLEIKNYDNQIQTIINELNGGQ
ncbi:rhomboid family intramembrane serine protease [Flavobacterium amnicola]|uniref:Rhomboid family intramembrane serine protease n=2 Tax=Flavobacterium amnicola TaxID=2506422 RepID=A0A4Q1K722_9FLAO|nr:rhomboid family intramembrane serine protease [Flavobacterium amnicola]